MSRSINTRREVLPLAKLMLIWLYWWIHYLYSSESETVHIGIRMLVHFSCGYTYYKCTSEHFFLLIFLLFYYYKILVGNCFSTSLWIPSSSQMVMPQTRFCSNVNHSRAWLSVLSSLLLHGYQIQQKDRTYQWAQWTTSQFYEVIFPLVIHKLFLNPDLKKKKNEIIM